MDKVAALKQLLRDCEGGEGVTRRQGDKVRG